MTRNGIITILIVLVILLGIGYFISTRTETNNLDVTVVTPPATTPPATTPPTPTQQRAAPVVSTDNGATVSNSTAVVTGDVNPKGSQTSYWYEYGKTTNLGSKTSAQIVGSSHNVIPATGYITGLTPSTKYYFRLVAKNAVGTTNGNTENFTTHATNPPPAANAPTASTVAATNVDRESATLRGSVNPRSDATSYWFEYGTTNDLGTATSLKSAGSGASAQDVSASVSNLTPNTKYFFRINAQNDFGTVNGSILSFTTAGPAAMSEPTVAIEAATAVTARSATLHGSVTPNGADTTYWFEYSTDSLVGNVLGTATPEKTISAGAGASDVSAALTGLSPSTKYNYRLAARNSQGTVRSEVMSFKTNGN